MESMIHRGLILSYLVVIAGCSDEIDIPQPEAAGAPPVEEPREDREGTAGIGEGGPIADFCQYVACLRGSEANRSIALLRVMEEGGAARIIAGFARGQIQLGRKRSGGRDFKIWLVSIAPDHLVYEVADEWIQHRLDRLEGGGEISVPGEILAAFVGDASGIPILHDARTEFARRETPLPPGEVVIDAARAKALLAAAGMPLGKEIAVCGRPFLLWASMEDPAAGRRRELSPGRPVLIQAAPVDPTPENPAGEDTAESVTITSGPIPLPEFLEFVAEVRRRPVYSGSEAKRIRERVLLMVSDIADVSFEIVVKLLELNGISMAEASLPEIGDVILMELDS